MNPYLIVIPAFNEAATIGDIVRRCRDALPADVLVIDDASDDDTAAIARAQGARVVRHLRTMGAWRATQTGFLYAAKHRYQYIMTIDADGQHHPEVLPELLAAVDGDSNVVLGSCIERASQLRRVAWRMLRRASGLRIQDLTSGMRVYPGDVPELLLSHGASILDFQDLGVLILLEREGYQLCEVPIAMSEREVGQSRIFFSWARVFEYMLVTLLLSVAKHALPFRQRKTKR